MRRAMLVGSLLVLVAALYGAWVFRFEREPGGRTWTLADLRAVAPKIPGLEWDGPAEQPVLRLRVDDENRRIAARLAIPGIGAGRFLHLRFRLSSVGLVPGEQKWEDGRFMIEWHQPGSTKQPETDAAGSTQWNTEGPLDTIVLDPKYWPAVPALRLEHLGAAGYFEVADLEITPVRERAVWKFGRWVLLLGWWAWVTVWIRSWPGIPKWRAMGASGIAVLMGVFFVVPGPWHAARPMGDGFRLGDAAPTKTGVPGEQVQAPDDPSPSLGWKPGPIPALGKLPDKGGLALRIKVKITQARPLLHAILLGVPCLCMIWLVGRRPAVWIAGLLVIAIEFAQFAFGYGFDGTDVLDVLCDAAGIGAALWVHSKLPVCWRGLK